jgi:anti-sigma B factor antagonist
MSQDRQPSGRSLRHASDELASPVLSLDPSGRAILTLRGEHDILAAVAARHKLLEGVRLGAGHVIMDLCEITVADESLMGLIVLALRLTRHSGGSVVLITQDPAVIRKLQLTGLDQMIPRYAALNDVPDAEP